MRCGRRTRRRATRFSAWRTTALEAGGPIYRGRAWVWGSYGKQDINVGILGFYKSQAGCPPATGASTKDIRACLQPDTTLLDNYNIKGSGVPFKNNTASWLSNFAEKFRNARDASDLRPPETVFVQKGPVWTHKFSDQHVFSDRLIGRSPGRARRRQLHARLPRSRRSRRCSARSRSRTRGPVGAVLLRSRSSIGRTKSVNLNASYFRPAVLGGDHAFKPGSAGARPTGCRSRTSAATPRRASPAARHRRGSPSRRRHALHERRVVVLRAGHLHARPCHRAGRRPHRSAGRQGARRDASRRIRSSPDLLPAASFAGIDPGLVWTNVSPRLGVTWDVSGTGRTRARGSYSRYYGQVGPGTIAGILNPLTAVQLRMGWTDANGDRLRAARAS